MTIIGNGPVYIGTFDPGSPDWLAARARGLGGSEIAAVLGISPYESRFSMWHRKAGNLGPAAENDAMFWGKRLEPVLRQVFREDHPELDVREVGTWRASTRPWQIANPDGLGKGCIWEGKYSLHGEGFGEPGTDEVPVHHRAQVLHYLDVFGEPVAHLSVFIGGRAEYREYEIRYDAAEAAFMRAEGREFLDSLAGDPPPLDGHDATYQAVRELHPEIDGGEVDLSGGVALPYLRALAACKDADAEKRRASGEVIAAMGSAQHARWSGDRIASRIAPRTDGAPPYLRAVNGAADLHREAAP